MAVKAPEQIDDMTWAYIDAIKGDLETNRDDRDFYEGVAVGSAMAAQYFFGHFLGDDARAWLDNMIDNDDLEKRFIL